MKDYIVDILLIIGWIIIGAFVLCQGEVSKFDYVVVLICCIMWIGMQAIRDYFNDKHNQPPRIV